MKKISVLTAGLVFSLVMALPASATLLGISPEHPILTFNNTGVTSYTAATDEFNVTALPIAVQFTPGGIPSFVFGTRTVEINLVVADDGSLTSGNPGGPDLLVTGDVGGATGTLLTGDIVSFGFEDAGPADLFDFVFTLTGGSFASEYPSGTIGIVLTAERSNFTDFTMDFSGDSKGEIGGLTPDEACDLVLDKTCLVVVPPSNDLECEDGIVAFTVRYTGPDMSNSTVEIVGGSDASKTYTNIDLVSGVTVLTAADQNGFSIDARSSLENSLGSRTSIFVNGVEQELHTSCSAPFVAGAPAPLDDPKGDPSPTWFVENFVDESGPGVVAPPNPVFADSCEIPSASATECDQRPTALAFRYNGGDCSQTMNNQGSDKTDCDDFGAAGEPVSIKIFKGSTIYADESDVMIGDTVNANAPMNDDFESESFIQVLDGSGNLLQEMRLHTSCSQPLRLGDRFGSMEVVGFTNDEQGMVATGAEVLYRYKVTNNGPDTAFDLVVTDDSLSPTEVPGSPIAQLIAGGMETLEASAFVDAAVVGTAKVTGATAGGITCEATDVAPIDVLGPPPCAVMPIEFKIDDDKFEWKLENVGGVDANIESIVITWPSEFGALEKVKFDGTIFEGSLAAPTAVIDTFSGDSDRRLLEAGKDEKLEFEFERKYKDAVPTDFEVTVFFAEGCSITFDGSNIPFGDCDGKLTQLTMIWDGASEPVSVKAYDGAPGGTPVSEHLDIPIAGEITVSGLGNGNNDVFWEIFDAAGTKLGESKFHLSCSDGDMNGPEDCGMRQGNGKSDDGGLINDWLLEGLMDQDGSFDCSDLANPAP